jgi:hypothetical protein
LRDRTRPALTGVLTGARDFIPECDVRARSEQHFFSFVPDIHHRRFRSKQIGKTFCFFAQLEDGRWKMKDERWNRCGGGLTITGVPSFFLLCFFVLLFRLRFRFGRLESGDQSCDSSADAANGCSLIRERGDFPLFPVRVCLLDHYPAFNVVSEFHVESPEDLTPR